MRLFFVNSFGKKQRDYAALVAIHTVKKTIKMIKSNKSEKKNDS